MKSVTKDELAIKIIQLELKIDDYRKWLKDAVADEKLEDRIKSVSFAENKFIEIFGVPEPEDQIDCVDKMEASK